jgi:hypothetical protein
MPDRAERCRQHAEDCRRRSFSALTLADGAHWLTMAEDWLKLAEKAEEVDRAKTRSKPTKSKPKQ